MSKMSLNQEVEKFLNDVSKSIPMVKGQYVIHVRSGENLSEVYFKTSREAASFMAGLVSISSDPAMQAYV